MTPVHWNGDETHSFANYANEWDTRHPARYGNMSVIAQTNRTGRDKVGVLSKDSQMINLETGKWRNTAEQLSTEMNSAKLTILVEQLFREMDTEDRECGQDKVRATC